jgi:hypothetical protein
MPSVRLDQVAFTTLFEAPRNYATPSVGITLSGVVANGATQNFVGTITYDRAGTRADLYLDGNGVKVMANAGTRAAGDAYQYKSTETFSVLIEYSAGAITVTLSIFNGTGADITLTTQTITASAVQYDMPIGALS